MNDRGERNSGETFIPQEPTETVSTQRKGRQFKLEQHDLLATPPEAISVNETPEHAPSYSGLHLEKLPWRGMRFFLLTSLFLVLVLAGWQIYEVYLNALAVSSIFAIGFAALVAALVGSGLLATWHFLYGRQLSGNAQKLREQATRILEGHDKGAAKAYIEALVAHYADKPQAIFLKRTLEQLPDYSNDQETLQHIEHVFLQPLDKEAARRVSNFSLQTAAAITISPWALVDMALALWRMVKMVDEVGQVYGIRPSLAGRWRLLKKIALQLVYVGASEVAMENTFDELGNDALGGLLAARGLQGLGAGIYSVRVGICAMKICRPIAFAADKTPRFSAVAGDMLAELKRIIKRRI